MATRPMDADATFRERRRALLNEFCRENGSNTPDFLLAADLADGLTIFDKIVEARETWCGRWPGQGEKGDGAPLAQRPAEKGQDG